MRGQRATEDTRGLCCSASPSPAISVVTAGIYIPITEFLGPVQGAPSGARRVVCSPRFSPPPPPVFCTVQRAPCVCIKGWRGTPLVCLALVSAGRACASHQPPSSSSHSRATRPCNLNLSCSNFCVYVLVCSTYGTGKRFF